MIVGCFRDPLNVLLGFSLPNHDNFYVHCILDDFGVNILSHQFSRFVIVLVTYELMTCTLLDTMPSGSNQLAPSSTAKFIKKNMPITKVTIHYLEFVDIVAYDSGTFVRYFEGPVSVQNIKEIICHAIEGTRPSSVNLYSVVPTGKPNEYYCFKASAIHTAVSGPVTFHVIGKLNLNARSFEKTSKCFILGAVIPPIQQLAQKALGNNQYKVEQVAGTTNEYYAYLP